METIAEILPFGLRAKARQIDPGLRAASAPVRRVAGERPDRALLLIEPTWD
jgi:hypothetical protein